MLIYDHIEFSCLKNQHKELWQKQINSCKVVQSLLLAATTITSVCACVFVFVFVCVYLSFSYVITLARNEELIKKDRSMRRTTRIKNMMTRQKTRKNENKTTLRIHEEN